MNLCVLDDVPNVERIYPAKIFELMALGRPILTLAPKGALTRLVQEESLGVVLAPRDAPAVAAYLERLCLACAGGADDSLLRAPAPEAAERYSRRSLAGEFARVFREAVGRARG